MRLGVPRWLAPVRFNVAGDGGRIEGRGATEEPADLGDNVRLIVGGVRRAVDWRLGRDRFDGVAEARGSDRLDTPVVAVRGTVVLRLDDVDGERAVETRDGSDLTVRRSVRAVGVEVIRPRVDSATRGVVAVAERRGGGRRTVSGDDEAGVAVSIPRGITGVVRTRAAVD